MSGLQFVPTLGPEGCVCMISSEGSVAVLGFEECECLHWALGGACVSMLGLKGVCTFLRGVRLCWVLGMSVHVTCIWSVCAPGRFCVCVCSC